MSEDNLRQTTLSDSERRMINMSALKSASSIDGSGDPDRVLGVAERFVRWIISFKPEGVSVVGESGVVPATEKQKAYMRKLGIEFDEDITKDEASKLIDEKIKQIEEA